MQLVVVIVVIKIVEVVDVGLKISPIDIHCKNVFKSFKWECYEAYIIFGSVGLSVTSWLTMFPINVN